jgi:alpha-glucosidase
VPGVGLGRDGCRTPMQWDAGRFAGFSTAEPWLPLGPDHRTNTVESQMSDPASLYNLYRRLIALRRGEAVLSIGSFRAIAADGDLVVYVRGDRMLVVLNLGDQPMHMQFKNDHLRGQILLSTALDREGEEMDCELPLRGNEGVIVKLSSG